MMAMKFSSGGESFSTVNFLQVMNRLMLGELHLLCRIPSQKRFPLESYRDNLVFWNVFSWDRYLVNVGCKYSRPGAMTTDYLLIQTTQLPSKGRGGISPAEIMDYPNNGCCPAPFRCDSVQMQRKFPCNFYNVLSFSQIGLFSQKKSWVRA